MISPAKTPKGLRRVVTACFLILFLASRTQGEHTHNIMLTGYWNPTGSMLKQFSQNPTLNPDGWEEVYYGGATNANPIAISSNGINTVKEAYIAGLDPTDPDDFFLISDLSPLTSESILSGRMLPVASTPSIGLRISRTGLALPGKRTSLRAPIPTPPTPPKEKVSIKLK